jgi:N-acetylneuraminic acid mutarotase
VAYNPSTNQWRRLPAMPFARTGFAAVWDGRQVLVWGGLTAAGLPPPHGEAYTPAANRWTALPASPLRGRADPVAVWTGRQMIVGGGDNRNGTTYTDGAAYTPATP